jgi:DNA-binding CsgD family transcriptional regulator
MASFIEALREAGGRKRARITDAQRAEVKRLLAAGQTGAQIAAATGLSLPSIQGIKKSLGLVKARNKGGSGK